MAQPRPSPARPANGPPSMSGWPASLRSPVASGSPQSTFVQTASGFPRGDPSRYASGLQSADGFFIGCEVDQSAAMAFQLAPRTFVMARVRAGEPTDVAIECGGPLDYLPNLAFLECSNGDRGREQHWASEDAGSWQWKLVVRHGGETVAVTLTAVQVSPSGAAREYLWKTADGWDPFGVNVLEPRHSGDHAAPLIVAAP